MLTVEQCRRILGRRAEGMTDDQVIQQRDALYALAGALIEQYLSAKSESDPPQDA